MIKVNGVEALNTLQELVDPAYAAVLVIDMQNEIVAKTGGYAEHGYDISGIRQAIPVIRRVLDAAKEMNLLVTYAEFVHRDRRGSPLVDGPSVQLHSSEAWVSDVVEGTWEAQTVDELSPEPEDAVILKSRASAIYNTYLGNILRSHGIRSVILTGCLTDGCVLKTAVDMTHQGFYPLVIRDGVGSLTAENHDLGLRYMEKNSLCFRPRRSSLRGQSEDLLRKTNVVLITQK